MARLGPWEDRPWLAVAVSGGPDSLCLTLLAHDWAAARGGEVIGLTVDHGLRPGSAAEASRVGEWLGGRGIRHQILNWRGGKPDTGIQEAARRARYQLLNQWVREHGCLHLLLAHTRDDQAETFVMRLGRGSGLRGLAAMPAVSYGADARLLRPLLGIRKSRLTAALRDTGQHWIDDPSNGDIRFERVRTRGFLARLENGGFPVHRLSDAATAAGGHPRAPGSSLRARPGAYRGDEGPGPCPHRSGALCAPAGGNPKTSDRAASGRCRRRNL